jgi:hypothetical protein
MGSHRRAPRLLLVAIVAIAAAAKGEAPRALPGPAPQRRAAGYDAAAENLACEACHTTIAAEWRGSLHHRAWDDPVFLTAYAIEPIAFCRACHVPEAEPSATPSEGARRLGVGCVTCHVEGGAIVGSHAVAARVGAHAVVADARATTSAACERCHQFAFPVPQRAPMQGTADEHRASPHAAETCESCHMPQRRDEAGATHFSHDFRVLGDTERLRSALTARASRGVGDDHLVSLSIAAARVGHAFPTGDMFRRLEVRARAVDERGDVVATALPVVLARRFGKNRSERIQIGDDRLPASGEARVVDLLFAEPVTAREVRWTIVYQRMDTSMAAAFGVDANADEVVVAQGSLRPSRARR